MEPISSPSGDNSTPTPSTAPVPQKKKTIPYISTVTFSKIFESLKATFYQSTLEEKCIFFASLVVMWLSMSEWLVVEKQSITGVNNFLFSIGWLLSLSSLALIMSTVWAIRGWALPSWIPSFAIFHIVLGAEIIQLGLIAFTSISSFETHFAPPLVISANTFNPMLIVIAGLVVIACGIFELYAGKQVKNKTIMTPHLATAMPAQEEHELDKLLRDQEDTTPPTL